MPGDLQTILANGGNINAGASASKGAVVGSTNRDGKQTAASNPLLDALTERLTKQGKGISSSSSSNLQNSINEAIASSQKAGELSSQALQSEREREVSFARDQAGSKYTTALEGRTGYATQVTALRELTDTTEKSVRDLDKRYQEAILSNDSATAQRISDLQIKKLEFQQEQEQNFFNNVLAVGNLQQQALQAKQQNEQFWITKEQEQQQFVMSMANSNLQFERSYGLQLQEMGLKQQQLEIERSKFNLSAQEYRDKKNALAKEKTFTNTKALVAQDMKNKLSSGITDANGKVVPITKDTILTPAYLSTIAEATGFDGTTEELSQIVREAYVDVSSDGTFMNSLQPQASTQQTTTPTAASRDFSKLSERLGNFDSTAPYSVLGVTSKATKGLYNYFTNPIY